MLNYLQHKYALSRKGAKDMVKAIFACVLYNLSLMLPISLLYYLVAELMHGGVSAERIAYYAIGSLACLIFIFVTCWLQYNATYLATYVESGVRRITLAEKLRRLPLSYFGKKDLADITSTIMADCSTLETASSHWIPELIGSVISTTLVAVSLFFFDWRMALASLWVLPIAFAIVLYSSKVQFALGKKQMKVKMACADGIQECLECVRDLKANNAEEEYLRGLDCKIKAVEKRAVITELGTAVFVATAQMILKLGIVTVALVGGKLLVSGELDTLSFFMFLLVVSRLYDPMQMALQNLAAMIATNVQCQRMDEILSYPVQGGVEQLSNQGYDIAFDHVGFAYHKDEPILREVSFVAKQSEVTALIGPSGGGKTTVSRLAARFWDVQRGKIMVGGMDISNIDPEVLLSLYSVVFQDVILFNQSILENIRIGRKDASDQEVIEAAKLANCEEFVRKLPHGWNTLIGENGSELSGGERQRISIARAFLKDAPIILLDEATAALDVENESVIQESLSRLMQNKTVLIIAHRMRTVANVDQIVVLSNGYVAQQGTPSSLMEQDGIYRNMVRVQAEAQNWNIE